MKKVLVFLIVVCVGLVTPAFGAGADDAVGHYGVVKVAVAAGKADATHKSELVTQLLFGELFKILKIKRDWYYVENNADGYKCWIQRAGITVLTPAEFIEQANNTVYLTYAPISAVKMDGNGVIYVPTASILPNFNPQTKQGHIGAVTYMFEGKVVPAIRPINADTVVLKATEMLNTPYLWGGKTVTGIDCSGLTQSIFKACGMQLPRDTKDQAQVGTKVATVAESKAGDLAFFCNADGVIIHVGIIMGNGKIIHASGRVKISRIDDKGIFDEELSEYTHKLFLIKRVI